MFRNLRIIAIRNLKLKLFRTTLTVLGVAFGLSLWIAIKSINKSTLMAFKGNIESITGKAALTVTAGEPGFDEKQVESIQGVPGVKHAVPMIVSRGHFAATKNAVIKNTVASHKTLMILGVDLLKEQGVRTYQMGDNDIIEDPLVFLNQPDSIILTHQFAKAHGFVIDSKIELATTLGKKMFTVRGLLSPEGPAKAYGGAIAIMDIDGARFTFGKDGKVDRVDIVLAENEDTDVVAKRLSHVLGTGFDVLRPEGQTAEVASIVNSFQVMLEFFSILALIVGLFMVTNSVGISVAERRKEIGTLRALGATKVQVLGSFLFESAVIGMSGSLLGSVFGKIMSNILIKDVTRSMSNQFLMQVNIPEIYFGATEVLLAVGVGTCASVAASLWPAYKATQVEPINAIKKNDEITDESVSPLAHPAIIAGFVFFGFSIFYTTYGYRFDIALLDSLNLLFSAVGAALMAPLLVHYLLILTKPLFAVTVTRLSSDNLMRNTRRTMSNIAILVIGLSFVILVSAVNISFRGTIMHWLQRMIQSDFLISSSGGDLIAVDKQPLHEDLGKAIGLVPGVYTDEYMPVPYAQRIIKSKYEGEIVGIRAGDRPHPDIKYGNIVTVGRSSQEVGRELFERTDHVPTVAVTESFSKNFNKKTGDSVTIQTPSGAVVFKIVGIFIDFLSPKGVLYMDRKVYKQYWKDPLVTTFAIKAAKGVDPHVLLENLEKSVVPEYNLSVLSNSELIGDMIKRVDESFGFMHAVELAALLVALLGILNTLYVSVIERTREIGLLRAVGMSRGQVFLMIVTEAFTQGLFGSIIAVIFGSWIAYSWMKNSLSKLLGWPVEFYYPVDGAVLALGVGIGVAVIAGLIPSVKASEIDIKEALEYE